MPTEANPPKVFISYSHDSAEHAARVLRLSDALCAWGFDCHIDQYELAPANWHTWMQSRIKEADFVLVICTEIYCRRFEGRETKPTGVGWEGGIITTELYQRQQDKAAKFVPVVFSAEDHEHIPALLQPTHRHQINIETLDDQNPRVHQSSENLYRHLAGMPRAVKPKIGRIIELPPINRREEFDEEKIKPASPTIQQPEPKIFAEPHPPAEKTKTTQSNAAIPTAVTLEKKQARIENTVLHSGKIEALPIEAYRVAAYGEQNDHRNFTEDLGNGVKLEMIAIPGGSFQMGSEDYSDTKPVNKVTLSPFHIGKFQVTQAQWKAVMGYNPSYFKGDTLPVEQVSWDDAVEFCERLSRQTGRIYRLPTEAEWEYACLAGSTRKYCFGDNEAKLKNYAWFDENSSNKTHPVGEKLANNWGLHDMHGNVWEWCLDWYDKNYYAKLSKKGKAVNPNGPTNGDYRSLRGGSWFDDLLVTRAVCRNDFLAAARDAIAGFRVVAARPPSS